MALLAACAIHTCLVACAPDPPSTLAAAQCREDSDCPGTTVCLNELDPGGLASCGCRDEVHCPAWTEPCGDGDGNGDRRECAFRMTCGHNTHTCACGSDPDHRCPPDLVCEKDRCVCRTDADCPTDCHCSSGSCVQSRGDDVLLCDFPRTPAELPTPPDAGPADGGGG